MMSAIIFVTSERAVKNSLAFVAGVLVALGPDRDADGGDNLEQNGHGLGDAVPFILLTTLIAALPLLGYVLFHRRAVSAMPKLRD